MWSVLDYVAHLICCRSMHKMAWELEETLPALPWYIMDGRIHSGQKIYNYGTLKSRYSEQVCQTLFVHYIKCNKHNVNP